MEPERIFAATSVDPWFLRRIAGLVAAEGVAADALDQPKSLVALKRLGFSDNRWPPHDANPGSVRERRIEMGAGRIRRRVDTCAAEFEARTPYLYGSFGDADEQPTPRGPVIILGGGPVRIGQGIEFDACCVEAVAGLRPRVMRP